MSTRDAIDALDAWLREQRIDGQAVIAIRLRKGGGAVQGMPRPGERAVEADIARAQGQWRGVAEFHADMEVLEIMSGI